MSRSPDPFISRAAESRRDAFDKIPIKTCPAHYAEGYSPQPSVRPKSVIEYAEEP